VSQALDIAPTHLLVDIRIHVTSGEPLPSFNPAAWDNDSGRGVGGESPRISELDTEKEKPPRLLAHAAVRLEDGRPNLQSIIREEIANSSGKMSVTGECVQSL
jgi:ferric-chelate reductase